MEEPQVQMTIRIPASLLLQIRDSGKGSGLSDNKLITLCLEQIQQFGSQSAIFDRLQQLYLDLLQATPAAAAAGSASWIQVDQLRDQVNDIDDKLDSVINLLNQG